MLDEDVQNVMGVVASSSNTHVAFRVFNFVLFKFLQTTLNTWNATQMLDEYAQEGIG